MKRVIAATSFNSQLKNYSSRIVRNKRFKIHQNSPKDPNNLKASVSEIHPYDDAEYTWARIGAKGSMYAEFIQNGKIIDSMQFAYFEPEYHDSELYIQDVINTLCEELIRFNKNVEPVMIHN